MPCSPNAQERRAWHEYSGSPPPWRWLLLCRGRCTDAGWPAGYVRRRRDPADRSVEPDGRFLTVEAAKGVAVGAGMSIGVLVALGVVMALDAGHVGDVVTPLSATVDFIALLIRIVQVVWGPTRSIGPFLALLALWSVGRKQHAARVGAAGQRPLW
ncbi:hypothetical protein SHIRM173S_03673 [Streptomyces hirsutus]